MIYYKQSDKSNTNDLSKINECKNKGNKYSFINKDQSCQLCDDYLKITNTNLKGNIKYLENDCLIDKCPTGYNIDKLNSCIITPCKTIDNALSYDKNCNISKCSNNYKIDNVNNKCVLCENGTYTDGSSNTCNKCINNSNVANWI